MKRRFSIFFIFHSLWHFPPPPHSRSDWYRRWSHWSMSEKWVWFWFLLHSLVHPAREWARCVHLILLDFSVSVNVWWWKTWKHPRYSRILFRSLSKHTGALRRELFRRGPSIKHSWSLFHRRCNDFWIMLSAHNSSCMRKIRLLTLFVAFLLTFDCFPFRTMRLWNGNSSLSLSIAVSKAVKNRWNILRWKIPRGKKMSYYRPADECLFWFEISELTFRWSPHFKNKS